MPFIWFEKCDRTFKTLKIFLANDVTVAFPNFSQKFHVTCDASDISLGAEPSQVNEDGSERPIAYIRKSLSHTKPKWSTIERECYAIIYALINGDDTYTKRNSN